MLRIRNLEVGYGKLKVLKRISLHVAPGEIITIIGANGAGKTTLLHTIAGLLRASGGEVVLRDQNLREYPARKIVGLGVSLVPEGRQVFATMTVMENLQMGAYLPMRRDKNRVREQLAWIIELFPVLHERAGQLAGTLSGGEQQMLAMGRALMAQPALIMMDEPSTGLAPLIVKNIFKVIVKMREAGNTVLLVEQNAKAALHIADRGYVMETGHILAQGAAADLLANQDVQRAYLGRDVDAQT
ncbi:MAG: branched-chain amino acid ABC transporter ATP-binding protein [Deltaproteobacteria bacterium CG_4_10_14_3_um_filter_60_8]|nr:MAG: branched-chain amino acid ABC transporter ATP-binding protein [Desulfobacterales bacterium CG2_30_60_27]PIP42837.1 MAG: branched-chain amino acid ABC transporter ATP-binding protein [Deltaproteobacteria bacterium CG23_combo_of_CG06-09_8_20_14_all_60_8]PIY24001.1 MAG: branched-chain amino acid ABC transporter ATP-binding protein [Deltaproteobacteria bacterium CG_4_10_14_3_um_filter_60_8]